jgi:hypothetical protein
MMETQNLEITAPEGFDNSELRNLYLTRITFLEGIIVSATSRGDVDEIVRTQAEIQKVRDAINAIT